MAFFDINGEAVLSTRAEVETLGRRVLGEVADATVLEQLATFYERVGAFFDGIEVVVNVVGGGLMQPLMDKSPVPSLKQSSCDTAEMA